MVVGAVAAALAVAPLAAQETGRPRGAPPEVVVTGRGEVRLAPDRGALELSVETRARTAAEAGSQNARRLRAVTATGTSERRTLLTGTRSPDQAG